MLHAFCGATLEDRQCLGSVYPLHVNCRFCTGGQREPLGLKSDETEKPMCIWYTTASGELCGKDREKGKMHESSGHEGTVKTTMADNLLLAGIGILVLNGLMYLMQPGMIFFPSSPLVETPREWGLNYSDVSLTTEDGVRLHGWYVPREGARRVLLFLHGNAGNISHRRDSVGIFHRLGLNVLIIDYRGYGQSDGKPSEEGLYRDALATWRYLTDVRGFSPSDILIFGRSLGGAVAAQLAGQVQAGAVILESSFGSARDVAHALFPVLSRLILLRYEFPAARHIARTRSPVLVLHSPQDEVIPYASGRRLFEAAPEPKVFVELHGDHNSGFLMSQPGYEQSLRQFLETHLGRGG